MLGNCIGSWSLPYFIFLFIVAILNYFPSTCTLVRKHLCTELSSFYGYLVVQKNRKMLVVYWFLGTIKYVVTFYKHTGYTMKVLWQTAWRLINTNIVDKFSSFFNSMTVSRPYTKWRLLQSILASRKHAYIILTPLPSYIVKLGFTGYTLVFLFLLKNIDCGYLLKPPRRGCSNKYLQSMIWEKIWKVPQFFIWKFSFFGCKSYNIFD